MEQYFVWIDHDIGTYLLTRGWKDMYGFSEGLVLLMLVSEHYDATEYIRDYEEFMIKIKGENEDE